jgi:tetratricopeptide (TPR) repeat protein
MLSVPSQHELAYFLQTELFHSLGSYGIVVRRLDAQLTRASESRAPEFDGLFPAGALQSLRIYNEWLRTALYASRAARLESDSGDPDLLWAARHPKPDIEVHGSTDRYQWVVDFFGSAEHALRSFADGDDDQTGARARFGRLLAFAHDPERGGTSDQPDRKLLPGRIERYAQRAQIASATLERSPNTLRFADIVTDWLGHTGEQALHRHVVGALMEAHLRMHLVEHFQSQSFGASQRTRRELDDQAHHHLEMSRLLNTFAWVIGRTLPSIFAASERERDEILAAYPDARDRLIPTYAAWIGQQISLLALHRRAYTSGLGLHGDDKYRDLYKLKRHARGVRKLLSGRMSHVPGSGVFLSSLTALAEHHTGRVYRAQHAYKRALRHFDRASLELTSIDDEPGSGEALRNSRWRVHLHVSRAKAYFELGRNTAALLSYVCAWKAYLELAATESRAQVNYVSIDSAIAWLKSVEIEPELDKEELRRRIGPLIDQLATALLPEHLRLLAAQILMRLGHLLFMLKMPPPTATHTEQTSSTDVLEASAPVDHSLARRCLEEAAKLDRENVLVKSDLLKIDFRSEGPGAKMADETFSPIEAWPSGGTRFDEAARIVEYILQVWLDQADTAGEPDSEVARNLLASFLAHTDSSNVRLAQVY